MIRAGPKQLRVLARTKLGLADMAWRISFYVNITFCRSSKIYGIGSYTCMIWLQQLGICVEVVYQHWGAQEKQDLAMKPHDGTFEH